MIIKSLSRKDPTFSQLSSYMSMGADLNYVYSKNLYTADLEDLESINKEFEENHSYLKRQKNSNALYHEVISISKANIGIEKQKEKLLEIVEEYIKARASNCLVYGRMHEADNNLHFHLMISSNAIEQSKNHYLNKQQFSEIKKGLEKYVLEKMPELDQKQIINKPKKQEYNSQKEFELKKRTGKMTKKESMQYKLTQIFNSSSTRDEFIQKLRNEEIEIYIRGKNIGFKDLSDDKQRKYRLNKLGLSEEFNKMSEIVAKKLTEQKQTSSKKDKAPITEINKPAGDKKTETRKTNTKKADKQEIKIKKDDQPKPQKAKPIINKTKEEKALNEINEIRKNKKYTSKKKKM